MKIGVVSDTHMSGSAKSLPKALVEEFRNVDLILHLGDWVAMEICEMLSQLAPVEGIAGNNDGAEIIRRFGERKLLTLEGVRIGMIHGHAPYSRKGTDGNALLAFEGEEVDCILFGHSHQPLMRRENGILLFNPGSPTDKRREKQYSFGLLEIEDGKVSGRHVFYDSKE
ncbi:YfcE family phosphodiesterase [Paenibacillus sp. PK3_47]|uniref:metallophosphoesterase family protein n=1 Tax=Paenibacillus sp. PK3_47 TaxID=2072642 RepID=UPI00201DF9B9|nr:metallophosphoesterase family protein [Paenibacillus sp. PK3_47]UQZ35275.1 YfcE family phosphodiesterase [Paenibacillus sp. PK3_47]